MCFHKIVQEDFFMNGLHLFGIPSTSGSCSVVQYSLNLKQRSEVETVKKTFCSTVSFCDTEDNLCMMKLNYLVFLFKCSIILETCSFHDLILCMCTRTHTHTHTHTHTINNDNCCIGNSKNEVCKKTGEFRQAPEVAITTATTL